MFAEAWKITETLHRDDPKRYAILKLQAAAASALSQYQEAEGFVQLAINWREVSIGREDPMIAGDLTEVAMLCRAMKDLNRGLAVLQRVASMTRVSPPIAFFSPATVAASGSSTKNCKTLKMRFTHCVPLSEFAKRRKAWIILHYWVSWTGWR